MYTIFVSHARLILTNSPVECTDKRTLSRPLKGCKLKKIIKKMLKGRLNTVYLYHPNQDKLLKRFKKKISTVLAAGGLVSNMENKILFIYRNKRWDLPKGKRNRKEKLEDTAVREVEEETGIGQLSIISFLTTTYHVFKHNNRYRLKETHWYKMNINNQQIPVPQTEEGITKVVWQNRDDIESLLEQSYPNIRIVIDMMKTAT